MPHLSKSKRYNWPLPAEDAGQHWHDMAYSASCLECGAVVWPTSAAIHDKWHDRMAR